jgi:transposase
MIRRYTFKMHPNAAQACALENARILIQRLYNAMIEQRRDAWDRRRISLSKFDQGRECTLVRHEFPEYKALGSAIMERCTERVDQAYKKYFDNFKLWKKGIWSKHYPPSPPNYQKVIEFSGFGFREELTSWRYFNDKVRLHAIPGLVKISGKFPSEPISIRTCDLMLKRGKWWISIVVKLQDKAAMQAATGRFSNAQPSNLPYISDVLPAISCATPEIVGKAQDARANGNADDSCATPEIVGKAQESVVGIANKIGCATPEIVGKAQDYSKAKIDLNLLSTFGTISDATGSYHLDIESAKAGKGPRGAKNREVRRAKTASRQAHIMHEMTSALAQRYIDITIERPALLDVTKSAKGDAHNHGAEVAWKASINRCILDWNAGKFCQMLKYKMEAGGRTCTVIEIENHAAMLPNAIVDLAKQAKQVRRAVKKRVKNGAIQVPTDQNLSGLESNYQAKSCAY